MRSKKPIDTILKLLQREHKALLHGDHQDLEVITDLKDEWLKQNNLTTTKLSPEQVAKIRTISLENQTLFEAALSAQKSVLNRLDEIRKSQRTLGTYSIDGTFQNESETELEVRS